MRGLCRDDHEGKQACSGLHHEIVFAFTRYQQEVLVAAEEQCIPPISIRNLKYCFILRLLKLLGISIICIRIVVISAYTATSIRTGQHLLLTIAGAHLRHIELLFMKHALREAGRDQAAQNWLDCCSRRLYNRQTLCVTIFDEVLDMHRDCFYFSLSLT